MPLLIQAQLEAKMSGHTEYSQAAGYRDAVGQLFIEGTDALVELVLKAAKLKPISMAMPAPAVSISVTSALAEKGLARVTVGNESPMEYPLATWACAHLDNYVMLAYLAYKVKGV